LKRKCNGHCRAMAA